MTLFAAILVDNGCLEYFPEWLCIIFIQQITPLVVALGLSVAAAITYRQQVTR